MPVRNAARYFDETLQSLVDQKLNDIHVEISIYNDGSSASVHLEKHRIDLILIVIMMKLGRNNGIDRTMENKIGVEISINCQRT